MLPFERRSHYAHTHVSGVWQEVESEGCHCKGIARGVARCEPVDVEVRRRPREGKEDASRHIVQADEVHRQASPLFNVVVPLW